MKTSYIFSVPALAALLVAGVLCRRPAEKRIIQDYRGVIPEVPQIRVALSSHSAPEIAIRGPYKAKSFYGDVLLARGESLGAGKI